MAHQVIPFLMFEGKAEEAMNLYISLFKNSELGEVERYGPGEQGAEGSIKRAAFMVGGQHLVCIDSPVSHDFTFSPSFSLFVNCEDDEEFTKVFEGLSEGGFLLMPPDNYGFSQRFTWLNDRFGVSWQLNLE